MTFGLREREREMANSIPIFRERESKWKIPIQFSGTGTGMKIPQNSIPIFRNGNESEKFHSRLSGRELEDGIPGNSREFPGSGIPGILLLQICYLSSRNWYPSDFWSRYTLLREGWMSEMVPKYWHCQI